MLKTVVIIPTYNEADNIAAISTALLRLPMPNLHLLIVDDRSPDGTGEIAEMLSRDYPTRVFVMHRMTKSGLGRAYVQGYAWALERGYEAVAQMDADLSHDPAALPQLIQAAEDGADVVLGSRYLVGISVVNWPLARVLLSKGANTYVKMVMGVPISDITSGFRVYRASALRKIDVKTIASNGYSFQVEMTYRAFIAGCKIVESPIIFTERRAGQSKMSKGVIIESAIMPWRLKFRKRQLLETMKQNAESAANV